MQPTLTESLATRQPGSDPALVHGDRVMRGDDIDRAMSGWTAALAARLPASERIGLLLPNGTDFPIALHALWRNGRSAVLLNPLLSAREVREVIEDAGAGAIVTTEALAALVPDGCATILVESLPPYEEAGEGAGVRAPVDAEADAVIVPTAGTGGRLRGARLSHRALAANAAATIEAMRLVPEDRILAPIPFIHLFGLTVTLNAPLLAGATVIPISRFRPDRILRTIVEQRVTVIAGVPGIVAALAEAAAEDPPQHHLRVAIVGGAPVPLGVARDWEAIFGIPLRQGYGLTEAGPVCLFNRVEHPNRPGALGLPFPGVEVRLLGGDGSGVAEGDVGELCIRSDSLFSGYLGDDGHLPENFHGDLFRTGDLGIADSDDTVRFAGMLKAMYTRNGFNVYPAEVARALEEDARIARADVQAAPDPARESEIVLRITPAAGSALDESAVRAICTERLAAYKQPGRVFLD